MPVTITNGYCDETAIKAALRIADTTDDTRIGQVVTAVSRQIDAWCARIFYDTGATLSPRSYPVTSAGVVSVDDFHTTTGLVVKTDDDDDATFETTWDAADYQVEPFNGVVDGQPGWPYYRIRAVNTRTFPTSTKRPGVQVTARWGWAAVPEQVREACLVQSSRIMKRRDSVFGVAGAAEFGSLRLLSKLDPDVELLLAPFRKSFGIA